MADDLTEPLGLPPARGSRRRLSLAGIAAGTAAVAVVAGLIWLAVASRNGGDTTAVATIKGAPAASVAPETTGSISKAPLSTPAAPATGASGLTDITPDGAVTDVGGGDVVIHDPSEPAPVRLAAAPREGLVEQGTYGLLPRIGEDGTRPLEAYARPAQPAPGMRRIAIIVGGIGVSAESTQEALDKLPGEVTLAFAPYGAALPQTLGAARAIGHEILLQLPLEPFDYPKNNPGPRTLTTDASVSDNLDRLHWLMSRITTYVGVVNYMGARFTADADKLAPVLADIGGRGLLYLDDGSSARSRAADAAGAKTPFLRADVILDADGDTASIDVRLNQLSAIARERGYAIGIATAFPTSIERIAAFAQAAADHGIVLVPLSSLVQTGRS
jgi:polysaccharide deacetylase 2 family uncharacterized protein YibQ